MPLIFCIVRSSEPHKHCSHTREQKLEYLETSLDKHTKSLTK